MRTLLLTTAALIAAVPTAASAAPRANGSVLLGVGAPPGADDPATLRLAIRAEIPVVEGEVGGLGVVMPIELATSGDDGFGFSTRSSALELAPSLRGRLFPQSVVRPYLDAGFGLVHRFSQTETWFGNASRSRSTAMFRSGLGVEIGGTEPGTVAFVLEPIGFRHYGLDGDGADRVTFLAGIQAGF